MDGRRTYLDTLNAGRQRRATSSLDELSRSLERLSERLGQREASGHGSQPQGRSGAPWANPQERGPMPSPTAAAANPLAWREEPVVPREDPQTVASARLAAEVKSLRDEFRYQMSAGLQHEFDTLRKDISHAYANSGADASTQIAGELEHISDSIRALSSRSDDRGISLLRLDIEQLRSELDGLARDDSVRSLDHRWEQFDQRWNELEHRIDARQPDPALELLGDRLLQITEAVNNLPESLSLKSLEDKVRTLAGAVDHFAQQDGRAPQLFSAIEQRLDEISRAIVASATAPQPASIDPETVDRIESRISQLAYQLDSFANSGPSVEILDRLNALSLRMDDVARQAEVPAQSVELLASQIAMIVDRIDSGSMLPDADEIMRGLENRFDQLAGLMEQRQDTALESSHTAFRDLEARLHDVISKLDERPDAAFAESANLMHSIDERLADFSHRLDVNREDLLDKSSVRELEAKIDTIASRFENAPSDFPQVDSAAISNLEAQIAGLSAFLSKPVDPSPAVNALSPRLEEMEKAIRGNRDMVIDAARQAAEDVARSFSGSKTDTSAVEGLSHDLKTLETLTKRSDDRNSKTFEAIHDTLLKIVDRLSSIETGAASSEPAKMSVKEAPSIVPTDMVSPDETEDQPAPMIEAVSELAAMPAEETSEASEAPKRRSMLSGLSRVIGSKKKSKAEPVEAAEEDRPSVEAPTVALDEPLDPKVANRPMQPGSGAPDLSRIMKRVREERAQQQAPVRREEDAGKSDFIAAARRAAQAAAAEAEVLKRHSDIGGSAEGFKLGDLLKARRKPILMGAAAVMIALAGLQLGKAFLSDDKVVAGGNATNPPAETVEAPAQATGTVKPAETVHSGELDTPIAEPATAQAAVPEEMDLPPLDAESTASDLSAIDEETGGEANITAEASAPPAPAPDGTSATTTASVPPRDSAPAAMATTLPEPVVALPTIPADAGPIALREAAEAGDPKALFEIAARYSEGRGTKADNATAAEWYERAAELGLAPAQYRIGNMLEKGIGVPRDLVKAKTWYQLAAEQGNASAMHNLAVLYAMGADGTVDNESAARWFNKAADLGVKDSQFNLGILNAKGVGMPQNLEESYKWFALVAEAGDRDAAAKRDEIANSLRPEQLANARAAAKLWKPLPVDTVANVVDVPDEWRESHEKTASVDTGKAIKTIQMILAKNGYDVGSPDGLMGAKTRKAIIAFQKDSGIPADGQVTERLVQELLARK
ncbi:MAG: peptidoglycan-binding protein [Rhizobiaceae bacterium]|nr:peptidoglycan-binding protein [Rhizobiaceae bacterium]